MNEERRIAQRTLQQMGYNRQRARDAILRPRRTQGITRRAALAARIPINAARRRFVEDRVGFLRAFASP